MSSNPGRIDQWYQELVDNYNHQFERQEARWRQKAVAIFCFGIGCGIVVSAITLALMLIVR